MATFTKKEILASKRYKHERDILRVLLSDQAVYDLAEVDKILREFKNRKV